jgi:hypothetical protein
VSDPTVSCLAAAGPTQPHPAAPRSAVLDPHPRRPRGIVGAERIVGRRRNFCALQVESLGNGKNARPHVRVRHATTPGRREAHYVYADSRTRQARTLAGFVANRTFFAGMMSPSAHETAPDHGIAPDHEIVQHLGIGRAHEFAPDREFAPDPCACAESHSRQVRMAGGRAFAGLASRIANESVHHREIAPGPCALGPDTGSGPHMNCGGVQAVWHPYRRLPARAVYHLGHGTYFNLHRQTALYLNCRLQLR